MKKVKFLLVCLLLLPFLNNAQDCDVKSYCNNVETINKKGQYKYLGCLDSQGLMHNYGKITHDDGWIYCGEWNHGKPKGEGLLRSEIKYKEGTRVITSEGSFSDDFNLSGNAIKTIEVTYKKANDKAYRLVKEVQKGYFKSDNLFEGLVVKEYENGKIVTEKWQYAEIVSTTDNQTNYYDPMDIVGEDKKTTVLLDSRNNKKKYYIQMKFEGVSAEDCVFDTGAHNFVIGKRLYEKLKSNGVKTEDLLMNTKLKGIGKEAADGKFVKFNEISIGSYTLKNVVAIVNLTNNYTLIGMDFLVKFSNVQWDMKNKTLDLYR